MNRTDYFELELTPRELQILKMIGQGERQYDIAKILGVSRATIVSTLAFARSKFGVNTTTGLLILALKQGLIKLEEI